jgi:hypothetical protein
MLKTSKKASSILIIVLCIFVTIFGKALKTIKPPKDVIEIPYTYGGNFTAWVSIPKIKATKKLPVIIYNYDEYLDWAGMKLASRSGYNLHEFMKEFNHWGYICIIPMERYRKLNALKGAIKYAKTLSYADPNNIHIVGLSEGAFLSLLSLKEVPQVASITLLAPQSIHYTGKLSFPQILREIKSINVPILFVIGTQEKLWRLKTTKLLLRLLTENKKNVKFLEYPVDKKWFRSHTNGYMQDIHIFLTGKLPPLPKFDRIPTSL